MAAAGACTFATPPHEGEEPQYATFYLEDDNGVVCPLQNADCSDARNVSGVYRAGLDRIILGGALCQIEDLPSVAPLRSINDPDKLPDVRRSIRRAISGVDDAHYASGPYGYGPCYATLHLRDVYDRVVACLDYVCYPQDLAAAKRDHMELLITQVIHSIERVHAARAAGQPGSDEVWNCEPHDSWRSADPRPGAAAATRLRQLGGDP